MKTKKRFLCTIDEEDREFVTLKMVPVDLCALLALTDEIRAKCLPYAAPSNRSLRLPGAAACIAP